MGYLTVNSIDELNNYIHSYGPNVPDEYKYIIANDKIIVYDKNDVIDNYRCAYYPFRDEYIICKTKEDYTKECDRFYEKYKSLMSNIKANASELKYWTIPGSIMQECLDKKNRTNLYGAIKLYDRKYDPTKASNNDTKDIRVFPGKLNSFPDEMQENFVAAGFERISNERGLSFQLKGCNDDEIRYWEKILKSFGLYYKVNESKYSRADDYRDKFFLNNKPIKQAYYLCEYCGKLRPISKMVTVEQMPTIKFESDFNNRKVILDDHDWPGWSSNGNKVHACKKCATLKGQSVFPWNYILLWSKSDGLFSTIRYGWRVYGRIFLVLAIIAFLINFG